MIQTSDLFKTLSRDPNRTYEHRATVAGVEYGNADITSLSISRAAYESFSIGNCCSATLNLTFYPTQSPPRMAQIVVDTRIRVGKQVTEYVPRGTFFINTRSEDGDLLSVEAFDAMPKAEAVYFGTGTWTDKTMQAVAAEIAQRMGIPLDPRTQINPAYMVRYPGDYTMREVLSYIAAAHGGNWIVTAENQLYLLPMFSAPTETDYIVDEWGDVLVLGGLRLKWR